MRLIQSDGQIVDGIEIDADAPVAVSSSKSDGGKATALVICTALCAISAVIAVRVAYSYHDDSVETWEQYQKERNHVIELEARLNALTGEVQELKHERR